MALLESSFEHGVMTVTLNDVERRNALSRALIEELIDLIELIDARGDVRVAVLTNRGSVFCAGANLSEFSTKGSATNNRTIELSQLLMRFRESPKPWVGRIDGHCMGGGVGLAAVMDISIASTASKFAFSEVRLGVAPAVISVVVLPKLRVADAQMRMLRGDRFSAAQAADMGLINLALEASDLDAVLQEIVHDLISGAPEALAVTKQLMMRVPAMGTDDAFAWTAEISAERFASDEAREGMAAFFEKRPARWVGRTPQAGD